jgi:Uma2 family endonuclease
VEGVGAPSEIKLMTGDELLAMGNIGRCELIDGRLVNMSPTGDRHAFLESTLAFELNLFVRERKLGRVMTGEVGIYIRHNPDRVRGADIAFVSKEKLSTPSGGFLEVAPELVIEIMSPTDRWEEVREKLTDYFSIGIEQVWIVEPGNRKVLVYRSSIDVQEFGEGDALVSEGILDGFALDVTTLFTE